MKRILLIFIISLMSLTVCANRYQEVYDALIANDVHHPEIVLAQAVLETGHFKSYNCTKRNNYFGLVKSIEKLEDGTIKYYYFNFTGLEDCIVRGYKGMVQYKYKEGEDYYQFLKRIGYATDPNYERELKKLEKFINETISK